MIFNNLISAKQGTVGLTHAIYAFCKNNWVVSVPINDTQDYDLVVDCGEGPKTVQVKTTRYKSSGGNYVAQLKSVRPNRTSNNIKKFDNKSVDYVYILTEMGCGYFIPSNNICVVNQLTLNSACDKYILESAEVGSSTSLEN